MYSQKKFVRNSSLLWLTVCSPFVILNSWGQTNKLTNHVTVSLYGTVPSYFFNYFSNTSNVGLYGKMAYGNDKTSFYFGCRVLSKNSRDKTLDFYKGEDFVYPRYYQSNIVVPIGYERNICSKNKYQLKFISAANFIKALSLKTLNPLSNIKEKKYITNRIGVGLQAGVTYEQKLKNSISLIIGVSFCYKPTATSELIKFGYLKKGILPQGYTASPDEVGSVFLDFGVSHTLINKRK